MEQEFDFETWFDIYFEKCRTLGYKGVVDKGSAEMDYDMGETPEDAARSFVKEME